MLRKLGFCLGVLLATQAFGQSTVKADLPASGEFVTFSSEGPAVSLPPSSAASVKGTGQTITLAPGDDTANVLDRTAGNVASSPISKIKKIWKVDASAFQSAAQVMVHVEANGAPATSAEVELNDGRKRQPVVLDSTAGGDAAFYNVKGGKVTVTVHYRDAKGDTRSTQQVFDLKLSRTDVVPKWDLALADVAPSVTATTTAPPPAVAAQPAAKPLAQPANPVGTFIVYLGALALAIGMGYGVLRYFKANPGPLSEKLEHLGVQLPKAGTDPLSSATPVMSDPFPKPQPPQKIILGDAMPDPIAAPTPLYTPVAVAAPAVSEPSLVTDQGVVLPLVQGETVVGRDIGLGLSLAAETTVSRKHASLTRTGNDVTLTDHGSTNGTFVNGARLQAPVVLRPGDAVQFGSSKFTYRA